MTHKCTEDGKLLLRITEHPILGRAKTQKEVTIEVDGRHIPAYKGEPIAAALIAAGIKVFRKTAKRLDPRAVFCAFGRCTDCMRIVDGRPTVRTGITPVERGMRIEIQEGLGKWKMSTNNP